MCDDIVDILRRRINSLYSVGVYYAKDPLLTESLNEIERLRHKLNCLEPVVAFSDDNDIVDKLRSLQNTDYHWYARDLADEAADEIKRLRTELAKHQESEFHPDWSLLDATRSVMSEKAKENVRLYEVLEACGKYAAARLDDDPADGLALAIRTIVNGN